MVGNLNSRIDLGWTYHYQQLLTWVTSKSWCSNYDANVCFLCSFTSIVLVHLCIYCDKYLLLTNTMILLCVDRWCYHRTADVLNMHATTAAVCEIPSTGGVRTGIQPSARKCTKNREDICRIWKFSWRDISAPNEQRSIHTLLLWDRKSVV